MFWKKEESWGSKGSGGSWGSKGSWGSEGAVLERRKLGELLEALGS